jgi:hypothetical protein
VRKLVDEYEKPENEQLLTLGELYLSRSIPYQVLNPKLHLELLAALQ